MGNMTTMAGGKVWEGQDIQINGLVWTGRRREIYSYKMRIFITSVYPANKDKTGKTTLKHYKRETS